MKTEEIKLSRADPLLDPIIPALRSHALVAAVRLDLFGAVDRGHTTATAIAETCGSDPEGTARLADALVACGYLSKTEGRYAVAEVTKTTLVESATPGLANWARFSRLQLTAVAQLEEAVQSGTPVDLFDLMKDDEDRLVHQRAMAETATPAAQWIAANVPVPRGATRMVDIGGSHGVYSAAICRQHPPMRSTIFELPHMISVARIVSAKLGTETYCDFIGQDFGQTIVEATYDVAFIGNLIHHFDRDSAQRFLSKVFSILNPGGVVAIWDIEQAQRSDDPTLALFSLFFFLVSSARCYTDSEIRTFLESAGFSAIERKSPGTTHCLYLATKPR